MREVQVINVTCDVCGTRISLRGNDFGECPAPVEVSARLAPAGWMTSWEEDKEGKVHLRDICPRCAAEIAKLEETVE